MLTTYFDGLKDNISLATSLPVCAVHIDLVRCPQQLEEVLDVIPQKMSLSLGVVDGRNIWKNDFQQSLVFINKAMDRIGKDRIFIAPSCSLLHSPCDLDLETNEEALTPEIKQWLAFAKQKVEEVVILKKLASLDAGTAISAELENNIKANESRRISKLIHNEEVKQRGDALEEADARRDNRFVVRRKAQQKALNLPLFPTTTIGSFPQTTEVRSWRAQFKNGEITAEQYDLLLKEETQKTIAWQEEIGLDVLVHGEFERNDMVEYFGEQLEGFAFTRNGWVQSYGSRCVKPPIIYGDVSRPAPMTVRWSTYAQSLTQRPMKGMLTGPVTVLQWSFVRDDQPRADTCRQIAIALRDEVADLEAAGIGIIQVDEPALREGLPLLRKDWDAYLEWAVECFRITTSPVDDGTQIHTHMCYSEFNDIIEAVAAMDADVISIETSRSRMELLDAFAQFRYPNAIGPGIYDIHSPRIPDRDEMGDLLRKATSVLAVDQIWVNPDCGLKTRGWAETTAALEAMVAAAKELRLDQAAA